MTKAKKKVTDLIMIAIICVIFFASIAVMTSAETIKHSHAVIKNNTTSYIFFIIIGLIVSIVTIMGLVSRKRNPM